MCIHIQRRRLLQMLLMLGVASLGSSVASGQAPAADKCGPTGYALWVNNEAQIRFREIANPCLAPEVVRSAGALGMARYDPPTVKGLIAAQWIAEGVFVPLGSSVTAPLKGRVVLAVSYVVPAIRLQFEGTSAEGKPVKDILIASGSHAWNEREPGTGATRAPAGALEQRLPLIWLTPHGAIWAAIDADPARVQVTQTGGQTVITSSFEDRQIRATLGSDQRPATVEVRTTQGTYLARYAGYYDPDHYGVFTPRTIEWTLDRRPLANLSVIECQSRPATGPGDPPCGFRANPYVVFPVPTAVREISPR